MQNTVTTATGYNIEYLQRTNYLPEIQDILTLMNHQINCQFPNSVAITDSDMGIDLFYFIERQSP